MSVVATGSWEQNPLTVQLEGVLEGDVPREKVVLGILHSFPFTRCQL